jgi:predicted nucleic acid-binding protein
MIVLDTNIISELMRPAPSGRVIDWLDRQPPEAIWLTSISVLEIRFGLELLADGARRLRLEQAFDVVLAQDLAERVLPFDTPAADHTARLAAAARRAGQSMELRDAMIAGIALHHGARLATRNLRHFADTGIDLENPWQ